MFSILVIRLRVSIAALQPVPTTCYASVVRDRGIARRVIRIPKHTLHNLRYAIAESCRQKNLRAYEIRHRHLVQSSVIVTHGHHKCLTRWMGD